MQRFLASLLIFGFLCAGSHDAAAAGGSSSSAATFSYGMYYAQVKCTYLVSLLPFKQGMQLHECGPYVTYAELEKCIQAFDAVACQNVYTRCTCDVSAICYQIWPSGGGPVCIKVPTASSSSSSAEPLSGSSSSAR